MRKLILGIETSCDETSIAILENDTNLLANVVSSQIKIHQKYGGVMPEIASRLHVEQISLVLEEALTKANVKMEDITAIALTRGPGLIGALHVGMQCAKTLAMIYDIPLVYVHHLAGHIYANEYIAPMKYPCMALVVSGGNTELVYIKQPLHFEIIGETMDDAIGEAYDKVARVLGLSYPGGPVIDKLSKLGKPTYKLPTPLNDNSLNVSYSGLKTAVLNLNHKLEQNNVPVNVEDMSASFQTTAIDILLSKTLLALERYPVKQLVLGGGVSANSYLREQINLRVKEKFSDVEVLIPPLWCCTDNAAMIAKVGSKIYDKQIFADLSEGVDPDWRLEDFSLKD
jgi:N6-L-threonylcarbamoyladenine synthase